MERKEGISWFLQISILKNYFDYLFYCDKISYIQFHWSSNCKDTSYFLFHWSTRVCFSGNNFNLSTNFVIQRMPRSERKPNCWSHSGPKPSFSAPNCLFCMHLSLGHGSILMAPLTLSVSLSYRVYLTPLRLLVFQFIKQHIEISHSGTFQHVEISFLLR